MKEIYKTKSQLRTETADAVEQFLRAGGSIQVIPAKKMRKRTTQKMSGKTTRQASTSSSGFARGYARSSFGG